MKQHNPAGPHGDAPVGDHTAEPDDGFGEVNEGQDDMLATAATVAVVGARVLIFEAALLPGLVLGVAAMLLPKHLPRLGAIVTPVVKSTVRGAYKMGQKTKDMFAEVQEQMDDITAEVDAEVNKKVPLPKSQPLEGI